VAASHFRSSRHELVGGPASARPGRGARAGQGVHVPATDPLAERDAWHLLRRAGFGARASEVAELAGQSRAAAVDALLEARASSRLGPGGKKSKRHTLERLQGWWLRRMTSPRSRLREKMALFWHDHFPSSLGLVHRVDSLAEQNALFRLHGLGPFRELLHQVTRDPAMLEYLDGRRNRMGAVNENYGRELLELFALGSRDDDGFENYRQADVANLARSLTGFGFDSVGNPVVAVSPTGFDPSRKTLFVGRPFVHSGVLGVEDSDGTPFPASTNVLDAVFAHRDARGRPTLARFLVRKLWAWFATPDADEAVVQELSQVFVNSGYVVGDVLRALLTHDAFYSEAARSSTAKTPVEFVVQALLALDVKPDWQRLQRPLLRMGMSLFEPPGVQGWQHGAAWLNAGRYLTRMAMAQAIASGRSRDDGFVFQPSVPDGATPTSLVDAAIAQLGLEVSALTRKRLIDYVSGGTFGTESWYEMKLRGLYALLLSLPEFQVH
jgi:uncharacterized protein (DUF1800 family)